MNAKQMMGATMMAGILWASGASAEDSSSIIFKPNAERPTEITMSSGSAHLVFSRMIWQAMRLVTPAGKDLPVTDLFLYNASAEGIPGGYWTKPELWDAQLSFKLILRDAGEPRGTTLLIEGRRGALRKQVFATIYPNESTVYVVSRLASDEPLKKVTDIQLSCFAAQPGEKTHVSEVYVDGVPCDLEKTVTGKKYVCAYLPTYDSTVAIISFPAGFQKSKVNRFLQYIPMAKQREMRICGIDQNDLMPGQVVQLAYMIHWNDGNSAEEAKSLSARAQAGEFSSRFYAPSDGSNP